MADVTMNDAETMCSPLYEEGMMIAGRYRLVRQLGEGGMGTVWLAEDIGMSGERRAIKFLSQAYVGASAASRDQFAREGRLSVNLNHQGIAKLMHFDFHNGQPYLVMQYVDGDTLEERLRRDGALPEERVVQYLKPIAEALDYAHQEGVVHRDVKPSNVMIRKDGRPFVLDFGVARSVTDAVTLMTSRPHSVSGTLPYMSPQQLNGEKPTPQDDIYSFAMMAYECLNGVHPFAGKGDIDYLINTVVPRELASDSDFARHVMQGLKKNPCDRPKSCLEFFETIQRSAQDVAREAVEAFVAGKHEKGFRLATTADQSGSEIQFWLGVAYARGEVTPRDGATANRCFEQAANLGHVGAQESLGYGYVSGAWCPADYERAVHWLCRAAEHGSVAAQNNLALCYEHGIGVGVDMQEAMRWYRQSAQSGVRSQRTSSSGGRSGFSV